METSVSERPKRDVLQEVYGEIFATWRYEVDSYWQRNNYFAAFETAALAGCWYVVEHGHGLSGLGFSVLGLASTIIWLITSIAVHSYIRYWWSSIQETERKLLRTDNGLHFATNHPGSGLHPSFFVHTIPVLFMTAWIVILIVAARQLCLCATYAPVTK